MPGVLIIEAMAQVGGMLLLGTDRGSGQKVVYFMSLDNVKFRRPVLPGDQLRCELEMLQNRGRTCRMKGVGLRGRQRRGRGGDDGARGGSVTTRIHPTAIVDPSARLGAGVEIGPWAIVGPRVTRGRPLPPRPRASRWCGTCSWPTDVQVGDGSILGGDPQDLKYKGEETWVEIGAGTIIREYTTINRGTSQSFTHRGGARLLHHDLRASGPRLPRRRRGDHRQRHPVRRAT